MEDDLRWKSEERRAPAREQEGCLVAAGGRMRRRRLGRLRKNFQEKDDEDIYFAPEKGNVVFASALGSWGFRIAKFAQIFAVKLGIKEANFKRVLWGDFYLDPKTKRVITCQTPPWPVPLKPLFVQFVLENIWAVYEAVLLNPWVFFFFWSRVSKIDGAMCLRGRRNAEKVNKIVSNLRS